MSNDTCRISSLLRVGSSPVSLAWEKCLFNLFCNWHTEEVTGLLVPCQSLQIEDVATEVVVQQTIPTIPETIGRTEPAIKATTIGTEEIKDIFPHSQTA